MSKIDLGKVTNTPKGEYNSNIAYEKLDIVSYQGSSYMAKKNVPKNTSITNTTYWQKIAEKGDRGEDAPQTAVTSAVNNWLSQHITNPANPPIDASLSISGAAADAAKTGFLTAQQYSSSSLYNIGDFVNYNGSLYQCISNIVTPEAWNNLHWQKTNISKELSNLLNGFKELQIKINSWTDGSYVAPGGSIQSNAHLSVSNKILIPNGTKTIIHTYTYGTAAVVIFNKNNQVLEHYENSKTAVYTYDNNLTSFYIELNPKTEETYAQISCIVEEKPSAYVLSLLESKNNFGVFRGSGSYDGVTSDDITTLDDLPKNKIATIMDLNIGDLPIQLAGTCITFQGYDNGQNKNSQVQIYITRTNLMFYRVMWATVWSNWEQISLDAKALQEFGSRINSSSQLDDCDNAVANRVYTISSSVVENVPSSLNGTMLTLNGESTLSAGHAQIYIDIRGIPYTRIKWGASGGIWTEWNKLISEEDLNQQLENLNQQLEEQLKKSYSSVAMFEKIGVLGDSFSSGSIHGTVNITNYNLSWGQVLARKNGINCFNYSVGGWTTYDFCDNSNTNYNVRGLGKLINDINNNDKKGLYLLCFGINDSNSNRTIGDKTGGSQSYLGSSSDIKTDYNQNPNTFWGNYGKIIKTIQTQSPNSKIIICSFCRKANSTNEWYIKFNNAIPQIANYFNIPYINLTQDDFFTSSYYLNYQVSNHPTAPVYAGYANAIDRLIGQCIVNNLSYFQTYIGV